MAEIKSLKELTTIDYMARDYDSFLQSMRALIPEKLPEWTDYQSEADFGNVLLQLFAHMGDILSYYQDRVANESFLGTAQTRRSIIHHLKLIGYQLATAAPASTTLTLTLATPPNESIQIHQGDAFATKSQPDKPSIRFEYTREAALNIQPEEFVAKIDSKGKKSYQYHGIPVEEGRLIKEEILGISTGAPNQRFYLAHPRLILRRLAASQTINKDIFLQTVQGEQLTEWSLQDSLTFSRDQQNDFIVEIDEADRAVVIFGDGNFGAIPPTGTLIKATYRVGGGTQGNLSAHTIQTIVAAPELILKGVTVTNPQVATGGAAREELTHAILQAPTVFRAHKRAVTADDYKALALNFPGVGKVRAQATHWNTVTLYVALDGGGKVSDVLKHKLLAYFEDKRLVTTLVEIEDVNYVDIYVTAAIGVKSYFDFEQVKAQVQQETAQLLAFKNVDFGKTIYLSKFYEAIEAIEGVDHVTITEFGLGGTPETKLSPSGKITLGVNEIPKIPDDANYKQGIQVEKDE